MAFNLMDSVKGLFTNELVGKMASSFGETEGGIQKALSGAIPSVLVGLLSKAGTADGASSILNMSKDAAGSGVLGNLVNFAGSSSVLNQGVDWLKKLFGDKVGNIISMIAGFAGIRESSASTLLNAAAPAALGTLGKQVTQNNLSVSGLTSMLASQKDAILNALPSGLNLAGALGLGSLGDIGSKLSGTVSNMTGTARATATSATKAASGNKWVLPLILALAVIGILIFLARSCDNKADNTAVVQPAEVKRDSMPPAEPAAMASIKVKLPDGVELDAYKGGIEDKLVTFLNDPASKGGKDVWFDFDNLNFETGSASLTAESMKQVNNIAAILKAYPKLNVKIGGYTDKSGDAAVNKKLSQSRADAVLTALKGTGANISQLAGAEGYGSEFAKTAADAPDEERKMDRRISLGVRDK